MIIGITGKKRSGKDTAAEYLVQQGFAKDSFAAPIKRLCADIFGWDEEWLNGQYKETKDSYWGISPRLVMQLSGTELFRKALPALCPDFADITGDMVWIKSLERRVKDKGDVVIPDVRFLNEARAIKNAGGYIIRIERPGLPDTDGHASEMEMDQIIPDFRISNTGSIGELQALMAFHLGCIEAERRC